MPLKEEWQRQGAWLFKRRSFIPVVFVLIILVAIPSLNLENQSLRHEQSWEIFCFLIAVLGLGIRIVTAGFAHKGSSGTNTRRQVADKLNTTGMYSIVRNPLYLGNFLMWLGSSLIFHLWWVPVLVTLVFWLCYERIIYTEEEYLREKYGKTYLEWANQTPAFIPRLRGWRRPQNPFNAQRVLRNEYRSLATLALLFFLINLLKDSVSAGRLEFDRIWLAVFIMAMTLFLIMRILKWLKTFRPKAGGK